MIELVDIKDISGNIRFSTPVNEGSKRKFLLMKEDYITLKFSLDSPIYFQLGDGVDNELGIFELIDLYKPAYNTNTGGYDYELRLDAYYWKWKNKKFFYTPQTTGREASWNLTASLDKHLDVFLDNLKALGYKFREDDFIYEIDDTVENASKLVSYDNVNLIDALTQMAETWECEWWIENHKIRFGRCEYSSPIDFKAGDLTDTENANVNSMQRSDSQTTYAIRVYAFGSTRNIPANYRKSLIFDVKEVKGRDISDTARPLDVKFFPNSVSFKEEYHVEENLHGSYLFDVPEREYDSLIALSAHGGVYQVISNGITLSVDCWTFSGPMEGALRPMPGAAKSPLLPGNYVFKASFIYLSDGIQKEVPIGNQTVYIGENQQSEYSVTFSVPDKLEIDKNVSDLQIRTYISAPSYGFGQGYLHSFTQYSIDLINGSSAETSVTFLSGVNKGKTFRAAYNPDLYKGDDANFIRLLEDVTASLGDRYTINNIIKGKVPDNYFSKDDKELTLNGVVQKRLMLPDGIPYVDAYRYSPTGERIDIGDERYDNPDNVEIPEEEAIEEIIILKDEYPKYNGSIFSIIHEEKEEIDEETNKPTGNKYLIYTFKDTGLKNFTKDFLLEELRLIFQTGKLAGLDFALTLIKSDSTGTTFEIVRNEDYGRYLPDDVLFPQAAHTEDGKPIPADTYVLHGFDTAFISEQMLPDAEQELYQKTKERVKKSMIDPSTYECEMDCEYIYNDGDIRTFEVGAKVNLINKAYFPTGRQSRIIGFEWPLDIPYDHPIYTVGETAAYSRIGEIESKLDSLTFKGQSYSCSIVGGGGASVYVIGVNDKTLPSDKNVFSSKKSLETFLRKDQADKTNHLLELLGGTVTDNIESQDFVSGSLGTGFILKRDSKTGRSYAEIDELYVRMKAIFESLTIKELRSVGGEILLTLAGIECTKVELIDYEELYDYDNARLVDSEGNYLFGSLGSPSYYRCFFTADDGSKAIINQFAVGDFAQCRQFDIRPGIYEDVSNRYYWRYVASVGDNYIDLSIDDCMEGSDVPQAGDKIIQLGNRTDVSRQNAILLSAYGLTAPTIQMLQGIDSYSLDGKAVKEEGFDQDTQQFYSNNYGRFYVGKRDKSNYIQYTPDKGVEVRGSVTLETIGGKVWRVDSSDGVNRVGDLSGRHIEINPNTCDVRVYNEYNKACTIIEGREYDTLSEIYNAELPILTPLSSSDMQKFMANIDTNLSPVTESVSKHVEFNPLTEDWFDIGNEVTLQYIYYYTYTLLYNNRATGSIKIKVEAIRYENGDMSLPAESYTLFEREETAETGGDTNTSSIKLNLVLPKAGRYSLKCTLDSKIKLLSSGNTRLVARVRMNDLKVNPIASGYSSRFFSNGLVFGDKSTNLFSLMNKDYNAWGTYLEGGFENESAGIKITNTMLLGKSKGVMSQDDGAYGIIPRILASGVISGYEGGVSITNQHTVNGERLIANRLSAGKYQIFFPEKWPSVSSSQYYVMLTGYGYVVGGNSPVKATLIEYSNNSFIIELSDDATPNDGDCFFEVKLY